MAVRMREGPGSGKCFCAPSLLGSRRRLVKKRKAGQQVRPFHTSCTENKVQQQRGQVISSPVPCQSPVMGTKRDGIIDFANPLCGQNPMFARLKQAVSSLGFARSMVLLAVDRFRLAPSYRFATFSRDSYEQTHLHRALVSPVRFHYCGGARSKRLPTVNQWHGGLVAWGEQRGGFLRLW